MNKFKAFVRWFVFGPDTDGPEGMPGWMLILFLLAMGVMIVLSSPIWGPFWLLEKWTRPSEGNNES